MCDSPEEFKARMGMDLSELLADQQERRERSFMRFQLTAISLYPKAMAFMVYAISIGVN